MGVLTESFYLFIYLLLLLIFLFLFILYLAPFGALPPTPEEDIYEGLEDGSVLIFL